MRPRLRIAAAASAVALIAGALGLLAPSADAAQSAGTGVTFSLTAGALSITAPSTATLANQATGATTTTGNLGTTTVDDGRGNLAATWTVFVTSTNFTSGAGTANETIPKANVAYSSGTATAGSTGTGTLTPGSIPSAAVDHTAGPSWVGVGVNHQNFSPTITVTLLNANATPTAAVVGDYSGTITQSLV